MNLRWGRAAAAADAAAALGIDEPRYRDGVGTWWTVSAGRWKAWRGGAWHSAEPPERVEGPAAYVPATDRPAPVDAAPAEDAQLAVSLKAAVSHVGTAYRSGWLSSDAADAVLTQLMAVDRDGGVWTLGFRSASWFRYTDSHWRREESPPDTTTLVDRGRLGDDSLAKLRDQLAAFLSADAWLPESVTEAWEPPLTPGGDWRPTHRVPGQGIDAYEAPDASPQAIGSLAGGLDVQVLERRGAWARVAARGGTVCWVDGRLLVQL